MKFNHSLPRKTVIALAVLLAGASVAQALSITVTGADVALLPAASVSAPGSTGSPPNSKIGPTQTSPGTLGQFDSTLGVLTGAVATATFVPAVLPPTGPERFVVGGGTGSASARSTWSLGGNIPVQVVISSGSKYGATAWQPISVTSSGANLNNFVGAGNIATNSFASYISVTRSSGGSVYAHPGTSISQKKVLNYNESIVYTYSTHSNASFATGVDVNDLTIDFGELAFGTSHDTSFSIFDLGGLGLTNFTLSFLSGDDLFDITGGNIAAGGSGLFDVHFAGQNPLALTDYDGTYRLTFTDNVSGLGQFASNSIGTNYIDLTMQASVAPLESPQAVMPEPATMTLFGLGALGMAIRRLRSRK